MGRGHLTRIQELDGCPQGRGREGRATESWIGARQDSAVPPAVYANQVAADLRQSV